MKTSKAAEMPAPGTGVGQKAEPACQLVAGVSWRLAGEAVVTSWADAVQLPSARHRRGDRAGRRPRACR